MGKRYLLGLARYLYMLLMYEFTPAFRAYSIMLKQKTYLLDKLTFYQDKKGYLDAINSSVDFVEYNLIRNFL